VAPTPHEIRQRDATRSGQRRQSLAMGLRCDGSGNVATSLAGCADPLSLPVILRY